MLYKIVFAVVKLFFAKLKVTAEHSIKEPAVFVCNHLGAFGPIAMMLYFPALVRPWVNHRSTKKGLAAKEIAKNLFRKDSKVPKWVRKSAGKVLEKPALWVMKALKAIPVYSDAINVCDTLGESVRALKSGLSIAVFADKGSDHIDESVCEGIQKGCIYVAHLYGRKSGSPLLFYPVHISRKRREIQVGAPVVYQKSGEAKKEIRRVGDLLTKAMQELAVKEDKRPA
ncbi:MAG: lysophospholipid acyltransferase family protein [Christensenellales bacterium]|jgi:hypothetical protein